ncbi:hypothetical protein Cgig2_017195 [Carnegiea gigantea]|uniref:Uncharacterized protein n=1 Tax=Carnegiea gigantea TaxID=171969 RepID=A0A9Q1JU25_9CARY|nr:hypothetical protein Cgig2_017195 [Carnegiea gigantea]
MYYEVNVGAKWRCESDVQGRVKKMYGGKGRNEHGGAARMVKEIKGSHLSEDKLWYSLKYERQILLVVEGDTDVRMIFTGNDKHHYLYVGGNDGPKRLLVSEIAKCGSKKQQTRLRLEGKIIEFSDHDEMSIMSDDAGDEETIERGCDEGTK